ncbi:hypothetical protein ACR8AL_14310 [Clavibacter sepedonicus]|nr:MULTISPECIES: hypothetical protein [Clavibacter]MBD5383114.1 hypothetical protein [Clavibacter sp.]UUK67336.1 hypothetical protein LRE50_16385 [Clavibacter sepedonicus]
MTTTSHIEAVTRLAQDIVTASWPSGDTFGFPDSVIADRLARHLVAAGYSKPISPEPLGGPTDPVEESSVPHQRAARAAFERLFDPMAWGPGSEEFDDIRTVLAYLSAPAPLAAETPTRPALPTINRREARAMLAPSRTNLRARASGEAKLRLIGGVQS